jgi:diadenosine tetraphosphate (Ap4A) HIT family hydrolase
MAECPFCAPQRALIAHQLAFALADRYPVAPGHTLIVLRRHVADFFAVTDDEQAAMLALLREATHLVSARHAPHGYNVGINIGEAAGQTIPHVHIHL